VEAAQQKPTATLGDVLYADASTPGEPEKDWVALVRAVAAGDQLALHALYERTHRVVFTLLMRITSSREAAEDLTVEVFYDVLRRAGTYDAAGGTVTAWIMNQARARALERMRAEQEKGRPDVAMTRRHEQALRVALTTLEADERAAIEAAFFRGLTPADDEARARLRSALHKLRQVLAHG